MSHPPTTSVASSHRPSSRWRHRVAGVAAAALSSVVLAASPASAAPEPIGSSDLHWGVKASFRSYITGIAAGTITASDGATKESGNASPYLWSGDGGNYDPAANSGTIRFNGTVKFSAPAHTIWHITISDPTVVLDGDSSATLLADVSYSTGGTESAPEESGSATDVAFADLTVGSPTGTGPYTFSNVPAVLTAAGSEAFGGFYAAGTALDPLNFTFSSAPAPTVDISDATVVEGDSAFPAKNATFTVSLSQPRPSAVSVTYATSNGTAVAPGDYTAKAATVLTFSAGQTTKTVTIPVKADLVGEGDETFSVVLSNATGIALGDGVGTGTITDNDPPVPHVSVGDVSLVEGNSGSKNAVFTVNLTNASKSTVSVKYATANGTAVAPSDYTAKGLTTLSFSAGQTSKSVAVPVKGDALGEADEAFSLLLSAPSGVVIDDGQATATIENDDAPAPEASVADASIVEVDSFSKNLVFTVTLSAPAQGSVSLKYKTVDGSAVAPSDYTAKALTGLSFSKGQMTKTVSVAVRGDTVAEPDESFALVLSDASSGLAIADGTANGTIVNDD